MIEISEIVLAYANGKPNTRRAWGRSDGPDDGRLSARNLPPNAGGAAADRNPASRG